MLAKMDIRLLDDGRDIMVLAPFTFNQWTIPPRFVSDGASIPRILWAVVGSPLTGKYRKATVLHDYLYKTQSITRKQADTVLLSAMLEAETNKILAYIIYCGVRSIGGWLAWKEDGRQIPHL